MVRSKRKGSAPKRVDDAKRRFMSWNMLDQPPDLIVLDDNDPAVQAERKNSNMELENEKISKLHSTTADSDFIKNIIKDYHHYITIKKPSSDNSKDIWSCVLGSFRIFLMGNEVPDQKEFWLYINETDKKHLIYYEIDNPANNDSELPSTSKKKAVHKKIAKCFLVKSDLPVECTLGLKLKAFSLITKESDLSEGVLEVTINVLDAGLTHLTFSSEAAKPRLLHTTTQKLVEHFYGISTPGPGPERFSKKHSIEELFECVKKNHAEDSNDVPVNVQHPNLKPRLREYQKKGVRWMLAKERFQINGVNGEESMDLNDKTLHPLYEELKVKDGQTLYYNKHSGYLVQQKPLFTETPPGGILADEMGLGKTVEVLACMMTHPRRNLNPIEPLPVAYEEDETKDAKKFGNTVLEQCENQSDILISNDLELKEEKLTTSTKGEMINHAVVDVNVNNGLKFNRTDSPDASGSDSIAHNLINDTASREKVEHKFHTPAENVKSVTEQQSKNSSISGIATPQYNPLLDDRMMSKQTAQKSFLIDHDYGKLPSNSSAAESEVVPSTSYDVASANSVIHDGEQEIDNISKALEPASEPAGVTNEYPESTNDESLEIGTKEKVANKSDQSSKPDSDSGSVKQNKKKRKKKEVTVTETKKSDKPKKLKSKNKKGKAKGEESTPNSSKKTSKRKRRKVSEIENVPETFVGPVIEKDPLFECICGGGNRHVDKKGEPSSSVECCMCGLYQHAVCVNYDLTDPLRGTYKCPHCHAALPPIPSGATLIISPSSISHQWHDEIRKHIRQGGLKVLIYNGVNNEGYIQPNTLVRQDIVITSYETLQREINYVDLPHTKSEAGRKFRQPKRFMAVPSPMVAVEWWRICLDEAQMVERTTTKTADMALRLRAVNRWCVTGTPIQRSINDLYGLLVFLGVDPYWVQHWWTTLLYEPYCHGNKQPLHNVLTQVMWRTMKSDVLDQICLPMQTEELHWLTFSPVEEHFYRRQYQECAADTMKRLGKLTDTHVKLSTLDRQTLHSLLYPLVRLRQACCHPQAVRGAFLPLHRSTMTMEELLTQLTKKARLECEEAHRMYVFAMNGLAAVHIIKNEYADAVEKYREVLRSVKEHEEKVRTDELQQLHTLHNLHEILATKPAGIAPTLRDDLLSQQIEELKTKYRTKASKIVQQWQDSWAPISKSLADQQKQFKEYRGWWIDLLQWVVSVNQEQLLIARIKDDLSENASGAVQNMARRFRDIRGLQYLLSTQLESLDSSHSRLVTAIRNLSGEPSRELITATVECCLRPEGQILHKCPFCEANKLFDDYEAKLYSFVEKGVSQAPAMDGDDFNYNVATKRQGTWADSETEKALKALVSFCRFAGADRELLDKGAIHMKLIETLKKEYKVIHVLWIELKDQVSKIDELDMATTRIRLRLPGEPRPETPQPNIIEPMEVEHNRLKFSSDMIVGKNDLKKRLGQLLYLKNLAKTQSALDGGVNPDPCPILCGKKLGTKWSVLQCGHCYCLECIRQLVDERSFGGTHTSLKCPICRSRTKHADITYVSTRGSKSQQNTDIVIKGDHSSKVEGIVRCLLQIQQQHPGAKALVFSTWQDVLDVLATAFTENNIRFKSLHAQHKFQSNLAQFRSDEAITVLLLPVHSGANGLNLIEATHVLLVEPILNTAQELQAIGRVHRIGQTKPTVVHRFLVRGTIEERMHHLQQSVVAPLNSHNSDETNMTAEELSALFREGFAEEGQSDDENEEDYGNGERVNADDVTIGNVGRQSDGCLANVAVNVQHDCMDGAGDNGVRDGQASENERDHVASVNMGNGNDSELGRNA